MDVMSIVCLAVVGSNLLNSDKGFNLLTQALAAEVLDQATVDDCLSWLEPRCSIEELADAVHYLREDRPHAPRSRSRRPASVMNPYLKYKVENGYKIPAPPVPPPRPRDFLGTAVGQNGQQNSYKGTACNTDEDANPPPRAADQWLENGFPRGLPTPPMPKPYIHENSSIDINKPSVHQKMIDSGGGSESSAHSVNHYGSTATVLEPEPSTSWGVTRANDTHSTVSPLARLLGPAGVLSDNCMGTMSNTKPWTLGTDSISLSPGIGLDTVPEEKVNQAAAAELKNSKEQVMSRSTFIYCYYVYVVSSWISEEWVSKYCSCSYSSNHNRVGI